MTPSPLPQSPSFSAAHNLSDPRLRRDLIRYVGRRVGRADVEDVVQSTFAEAIGARALPSTNEEIRRFVFVIAGQKVADLHRRRARKEPSLPDLSDTIQTTLVENDLLRWAERETPRDREAKQTFDWMLREADGETLADIATTEGIAAATVRQRVSRLRRFLRGRWTKEIAIATAVGIVAAIIAIASLLRTNGRVDVVAPSVPGPTKAPEITPDRAAPAAPTAPSPTTAPPIEPAPPPTTNEPAPVIAPPPPPFDLDSATRALESVNLGSCTPHTPMKRQHVTVTFAPGGKVTDVSLESPLAGTPDGSCVSKRFESVHVPAFAGTPVKLRKSFFFGRLPVVPVSEPTWDILGSTPAVPTSGPPSKKPQIRLDKDIWDNGHDVF